MSIDLSAVKRLCEAATPGPWTFVEPEAPAGACEVRAHDGEEVADFVSQCESGGFNAALIAASRTLIPELVTELEQTRAALHEALGEWEAWVEDNRGNGPELLHIQSLRKQWPL